MTRLVRGADGRMWTVRSRLEWVDPVREEEFEHDVSGGRVGAVFMVVVLFVLFIAFVFLTPDTVVFPGWLALAFVLLVLFFPARWLVRRPWTLVAHTPGGGTEDLPAARWVGTVRGYFTARSETARVGRHLKNYSVPDRDGDGPLQPVN
ncbi:MAG TPA: DUF983 domain-containing protein [Pseudonocardiaceae bacterium]